MHIIVSVDIGIAIYITIYLAIYALFSRDFNVLADMLSKEGAVRPEPGFYWNEDRITAMRAGGSFRLMTDASIQGNVIGGGLALLSPVNCIALIGTVHLQETQPPQKSQMIKKNEQEE